MTLEEQLAALRRALARGVKRVQQGSEMVEYNTPAELRAAIADLEAQLGLRAPGAGQVYPRFVERPR